MKQFPDYFRPSETKKLEECKYNRLLCYLRRDVFEHVLSHEETDYFSLDDFNTRRVQNMELTVDLVNKVITELVERGWKCTLSFGGTGLFIYRQEKPKNCWD